LLQARKHGVQLYLKEKLYGENGLLMKTRNTLGQNTQKAEMRRLVKPFFCFFGKKNIDSVYSVSVLRKARPHM
jgi:hypothetical protein